MVQSTPNWVTITTKGLSINPRWLADRQVLQNKRVSHGHEAAPPVFFFGAAFFAAGFATAGFAAAKAGFAAAGFDGIVADAVDAAVARGRELSEAT